jgi:hypothetical protein
VRVVVDDSEAGARGPVADVRFPRNRAVLVEGQRRIIRGDEWILEVNVEWNAKTELLLEAARQKPARRVSAKSVATIERDPRHRVVSFGVER